MTPANLTTVATGGLAEVGITAVHVLEWPAAVIVFIGAYVIARRLFRKRRTPFPREEIDVPEWLKAARRRDSVNQALIRRAREEDEAEALDDWIAEYRKQQGDR